MTAIRCRLLLLLISLSFCQPLLAVQPPLMVDGDADGVSDEIDECPYTRPGVRVNAVGCPLKATDGDADGVPDEDDDCPYTPPGAVVDAHGCALDGDLDGIADGIDRCPNTPVGLHVDADGCAASEIPLLPAAASTRSTQTKPDSGKSKPGRKATLPHPPTGVSSASTANAPSVVTPAKAPVAAMRKPLTSGSIRKLTPLAAAAAEPTAAVTLAEPPTILESKAQAAVVPEASIIAAAEPESLILPSVAELKKLEKPKLQTILALKTPALTTVSKVLPAVVPMPAAPAPIVEPSEAPAPVIDPAVRQDGMTLLIHFAEGSAQLSEQDQAKVRTHSQTFLQVLKERPDARLSLKVVDAEKVPTAASVQSKRIVLLRSLLVQQGISAARIRAVSGMESATPDSAGARAEITIE